MRSQLRALTLITLALASTACVRRQTDPVTGKSDFDIESPWKKGEDWKTTLAGKPGYESLTGRADLRSINSETSISISLNGARSGSTHPWHLHDGTCDSTGPIVGPASAYSPLVVGNEGQAVASARLTMGLNEAKQYNINVHASPSELSTIIACGNLTN
jgi:hypothetical protein